MKFPHPIKPHPAPAHPDRTPGSCTYTVTDTAAHRRYLAKDSQWRMHNIAKHVALMPNKSARQVYCEQVEKKLPLMAIGEAGNWMARFRRLVIWYWRGQRKLQQQTNVST